MIDWHDYRHGDWHDGSYSLCCDKLSKLLVDTVALELAPVQMDAAKVFIKKVKQNVWSNRGRSQKFATSLKMVFR